MITLRASQERGHFNHGWLETYHTFSFADYYDPGQMGFRSLRVINEDFVAPGEGFGTHPHRDMEIVTYVIQGALEHRDSMKNGSVIRANDIQYMSAGTGVTHSEFNHSKSEKVHLLQIWILPDEKGHKPRYGQNQILPEAKRNQLKLLVSSKGEAGSIAIHQDVKLYATILDSGKSVKASLGPNRHGWLQLIRGEVLLNGMALRPGDGAAISQERAAEIQNSGSGEAEFLFFDLN